MPSTSILDLSPEPDLHPLYPTTTQISNLLASNSGLDPNQKPSSYLIAYLSVLQHILSNSQTQSYLDLNIRDDDGLGLVSLTIQGFSGDVDHDVEREECVRLLVSQGAELTADNAGWTPLHYAALLSPPTLVSYLMTHGCSPFSLTRRSLTPLDVVTAHSLIPGREDIAFLLEESMRSEGWTGGRMEQRRRVLERRTKRKLRHQEIREDVAQTLNVNPKSWYSDSDTTLSESDSEDSDDGNDEAIYTPEPDYASMLVFSPPALPQIFDSLITNFEPRLGNATPANVLYMLTRFACLTCDHTWAEDLIIGATDAIEDTFFDHGEDITCLVFWMYNVTLWLHLLQCDKSIREACEAIGAFEILEEVVNSVFVFITRFAEKRIDRLLDSALLDYIPLLSEFENVQFESEWSFLRPFSGKRKHQSSGSGSVRGIPSGPPTPLRPASPTYPQSAQSPKSFSSLRQTLSRNRAGSITPLSSLFPDTPPPPSPLDLTAFLTALHTLFVLSDINPALTTQLWSQVMYWTSCEIFNRVITRKKYLCRSRALQIGVNLSALEDWVEEIGLPPAIRMHFSPVKDLLNWLQCLSSITDFSDLVATIQSMKSVNPLQMRRAVRDYKYEVNEGRMTDECIQYLTQLQKDWERHRVKLGVEALRKELVERDQESREGSVSSFTEDTSRSSESSSVPSSSHAYGDMHNIDILFSKTDDALNWEPIRPPEPLGELLDSRYMLPLLLPSDPRLLGALPAKKRFLDEGQRLFQRNAPITPDSRSSSCAGDRIPISVAWRRRNRKVREVGISALRWVDGATSASRWGRPVDPSYGSDDDEQKPPSYISDDGNEDVTVKINVHVTSFTRRPSTRGRGRQGMGETTPVAVDQQGG
ncbi:DIL domain-containing protein [Cyathus striatus]|nr:DIL domain-containing protein [Cyathus striatus]